MPHPGKVDMHMQGFRTSLYQLHHYEGSVISHNHLDPRAHTFAVEDDDSIWRSRKPCAHLSDSERQNSKRRCTGEHHKSSSPDDMDGSVLTGGLGKDIG